MAINDAFFGLSEAMAAARSFAESNFKLGVVEENEALALNTSWINLTH